MYIRHVYLFIKCVHAPLLLCVLNIIRAQRVLASLSFLAEMPVSPSMKGHFPEHPGLVVELYFPPLCTRPLPVFPTSFRLHDDSCHVACALLCPQTSKKEALAKHFLNNTLGPHCPPRTCLTARAGGVNFHLAVPSYPNSDSGTLRRPLTLQLSLGKQKRTRSTEST